MRGWLARRAAEHMCEGGARGPPYHELETRIGGGGEEEEKERGAGETRIRKGGGAHRRPQATRRDWRGDVTGDGT